VRELRGHFSEIVARSGPEGALEALKTIGDADSYAASLAATDDLRTALATKNPMKRLHSSLAAVRSGALSSASLGAAAAFQIVAFSFAALVILKIFAWERVGVFFGPDGKYIVGFNMDDGGGPWREVAGHWSALAFVCVAILAHFCAARFLRIALKQQSTRTRTIFSQTGSDQ
jgi:hypothetical protein